MTKTFWQSPAIALLTAALICCTAAYAQNQPNQQTPKPQQAQKKPAKPPEPTEQAVLLGQFGSWGAYTATPGGKKVCFALAKPTAAVTEPAGRKRDPSYAFVSTRPTEKVRNEVSMIVGYPQKAGVDAAATIGSANYVMYTQNDGAWVKNAAEEAQMVETMRKGADLVIKSVSAHGTKTTDTYSLKGLSEALDKVAQECK
jgi:invasion protein IalB